VLVCAEDPCFNQIRKKKDKVSIDNKEDLTKFVTHFYKWSNFEIDLRIEAAFLADFMKRWRKDREVQDLGIKFSNQSATTYVKNCFMNLNARGQANP